MAMSHLLPSRLMIRLIVLALVCFPLAPIFAYQASPSVGTRAGHLIDKVLGVVGEDEPTLTERKRFHLYLLSTTGPVPILAEAAGAGIGQWENTPKEWGQGWGAYGQRFGRSEEHTSELQSHVNL